MPTPKEPSGSSGAHYASAWVGIDGDTCGTAILQTGVDFNVNGNSVSYDGESALPLSPVPVIAISEFFVR